MSETARRRPRAGVIPPLALLLTLSAAAHLPRPASAAEEERPHVISVQAGGQIHLAAYKSWLEVALGYAHHLSGLLWLDLGTSALVHHDTNLGFIGGVRWKFGQRPSGVRAFLRTGLELALLLEGKTRVAVAGRVGGGAGYFSSPGFGMTLEAGLSLGPAFGDGVQFASALDLLLGAEFPF